MTWHSVVAAAEEFVHLVGTIRTAGGIITSSYPCPAGFLVSYVTKGT